jgi:hypothetical protein
MRIARVSGAVRFSVDSGAESILQQTGYGVIRDGNDWIIPDDDPKLLAGPDPVLQTVAVPFSFTENSYEEIAAAFVSEYLTEIEEWREHNPPPASLQVNPSFGIRSQLQEIHNLFFRENREKLAEVLVKQILPFMHRIMGAVHVAPLKISFRNQYGFLGFAKISYFIEEFGLGRAVTLVQENAMGSVLPAAPEVLSYVLGLLSFIPLASTLPVDRMGSQLHFFGPRGPWLFPFEATRGIFEISSSHGLPMSEIGRPPFINLSAEENRQYFFLAVDAVNSLLRFLNDPRNFVYQTGEVDLLRFLKTHSAVHLMFADLLAINHTTSINLHARAAFSFMDKLSNLKVTSPTSSDAEIFNRLFSAHAGQVVAKILSDHGSKRHVSLGKALKECAEAIFGGIQSHLSAALPSAHSEQDRLDRIRLFRNTVHGTFLKAGKFEKAFASSSATIPPQIVHVPLLYAWALSLDPHQVLAL